ncbi:MAG: acetylornithine transaminase [Candidatus Promineifilaceae bacterium]|jgi:predicted acetylornithine/succinylornithine family transaminase
MEAEDIIKLEADFVLQTYVRPDVVFTHGEGAVLYDSTGKPYLDFMSGIAVTALGHSDPDWVSAVCDQAGKLVHVSNLYHTAPQAMLAQRLVENSFADRVYFCNSGTEANEAAFKFARKYARETAGEESKTKIVAFSGSFHGRTMGSLAATYKAHYREPFEPLMPGVVFISYNDSEAAREAIDDQVCAVIVEPVQGEGGVRPATAEFLAALRALCDEHHALLIFDEVQCGLGRTGTLWAYESTGVTPDIMTLAKPLAGGLPIGATLVTQAVADVIKPGDHASTFAAGPLVCRAALTVFDRLSGPGFLANVRAQADYLQHRLSMLESDLIVEVRAAGLLVGVEMKIPVAPLIAGAREQGLLVINAGDNVLRLAPPLIIDREAIDQAVIVMADILQEFEA